MHSSLREVATVYSLVGLFYILRRVDWGGFIDLLEDGCYTKFNVVFWVADIVVACSLVLE